jgi:hypothetical protein
MMWQVRQPCDKHNRDRIFLRVVVSMPPAAGRDPNAENHLMVYLCACKMVSVWYLLVPWLLWTLQQQRPSK